jgi:hypothetical protein
MTLQDDAMDSKGVTDTSLPLASQGTTQSAFALLRSLKPALSFLCNGGRIDARMISRNTMQSLTVTLHKVGIITLAASPRT